MEGNRSEANAPEGLWSAPYSRTVVRLGESRTVSGLREQCGGRPVERRQALAIGGPAGHLTRSEPPKHSALTIGLPGSKPPETHTGPTPNTRTSPPTAVGR
jgi:hypothetical protein